jgi:hypothetical protein
MEKDNETGTTKRVKKVLGSVLKQVMQAFKDDMEVQISIED